jgi:hypothetical protein
MLLYLRGKQLPIVTNGNKPFTYSVISLQVINLLFEEFGPEIFTYELYRLQVISKPWSLHSVSLLNLREPKRTKESKSIIKNHVLQNMVQCSQACSKFNLIHSPNTLCFN